MNIRETKVQSSQHQSIFQKIAMLRWNLHSSTVSLLTKSPAYTIKIQNRAFLFIWH